MSDEIVCHSLLSVLVILAECIHALERWGGSLKVPYKHAYVACISLETFLELACQLSENCFSVLVFAVLIYTFSVGL